MVSVRFSSRSSSSSPSDRLLALFLCPAEAEEREHAGDHCASRKEW